MRPPESFVSQPIRSLQTMLQYIAQSDPSYAAVIPDGIYGTETMQAVAAFQRKHTLPVTGIADQQTWEAIVAVFEPVQTRFGATLPVEVVWNPDIQIKKGDRHPGLYLVQGMLAALADAYHSISHPSHTGALDDLTEESLASFQMLSGLPMTGQMDRVTWKHLSLQYPTAVNRLTAKRKA